MSHVDFLRFKNNLSLLNYIITTLSSFCSFRVYCRPEATEVREMVGKSEGEEEKEPEGIEVVGPSGEAIVYSSGNTPLFFFFFSNKSFMNCSILYFMVSYSFMIGWICILNHIWAHVVHR